MTNRRIIDQTEAMSLSGDDYLVADNANLGTRKIQFTRLLSGATPLPPNYKTGLEISRVSATEFSVASGYIRSDDNSRNIRLSASLIKDISATFDLGNNAGCMPSGLTLQANTKYYVFAISTSGGNTDIIVDTSIDCLNGLADNVVVLNNFDKFAKLGYFITNASSQIVLSQIENQDFKIKTGSIIPFAGSTIPDGYLVCNGSAISRTTYADLFKVIGTIYGVGNGSTTFNLPNLYHKVPFMSGQLSMGTEYFGRLPNITGSSTNFIKYPGTSTGALQGSGTATGDGTAQAGANNLRTLTFDASLSNSVYGRDTIFGANSVIPRSLIMQYIIKY